MLKSRAAQTGGHTAEAAGTHVSSIDELFRRYARYVGAVGLRILGRREEVDDLVQDVFVATIRGLDQLNEPAAIKAWLLTVTVRQARRRLRQRRLRALVGLDQVVDYDQTPDAAAPPDRRALLAQVYRVLDRIPTDARLAWTLRHIEGETLPAVAALCGCSLATAKRRIAAAASDIEEALNHV